VFHWKIPRQFFYLFFILVLIFFLELTGIFKPLRKLAEKSLIIPLRQTIFDFKQLTQKTTDQEELFKKQVMDLESKIISLEEENRQQKRLLSAPLPKDWQFLTVKVIGAENETLIVTLPENEKIEQKLTAVSGDTYLGKISQISSLQATIKLPSFLDNKLSVSIFSSKDNSLTGRGLLVGGGEGKMKVEQILLTENVNINDLVMTDVFGKNLLVGLVSEIVEKKGEMFKSAVVKRQFSPRQLQTIFLIKK